MNKEQFADAIIQLYERSCVGGNCHIVIDDYNVDNSAIKWCIGAVDRNYHEQTPEIQEVERAILNHILLIPMEEREELIRYGHEKRLRISRLADRRTNP